MLEVKPETTHLTQTIKCQCCHHIETSRVVCSANQLTGFYVMATLVFNWLKRTNNQDEE